MKRKKAVMGKLTEQGLSPVLHAACAENWNGALRLRNKAATGTIWFVKGQIVHCHLEYRSRQQEGLPAFDKLMSWRSGAFLLDTDALPPDRTIRFSTTELLERAIYAVPVNRPVTAPERAEVMSELETVLGTLRNRVPGLESLSVLNGDSIEATTANRSDEREWLDQQLHSYFMSGTNNPAKLFFEKDEHSLLVIRNGLHATVLAAKSGTSPEAIFWAGEEASKQMSETGDDR